MEYAILSDIHGNLPALNAALAECESAAVEQYLCLGDVAMFGPQPSECVARLRQLDGQFIMGNTDEYALDPFPLEWRNEESKYFNAIESWSAAQMTAEDKAFIKTFAPHLTIELSASHSLLAYHGSPLSFNDPIKPETPWETLDPYFAGQSHTFLAGGHVHLQFQRPFHDMILFNPGSVGLPIRRKPGSTQYFNPAYAEFAILDTDGAFPGLSFQRAPYPLAELVAAVEASEMPEKEWWLSDWEQ